MKTINYFSWAICLSLLGSAAQAWLQNTVRSAYKKPSWVAPGPRTSIPRVTSAEQRSLPSLRAMPTDGLLPAAIILGAMYLSIKVSQDPDLVSSAVSTVISNAKEAYEEKLDEAVALVEEAHESQTVLPSLSTVLEDSMVVGAEEEGGISPAVPSSSSQASETPEEVFIVEKTDVSLLSVSTASDKEIYLEMAESHEREAKRYREMAASYDEKGTKQTKKEDDDEKSSVVKRIIPVIKALYFPWLGMLPGGTKK